MSSESSSISSSKIFSKRSKSVQQSKELKRNIATPMSKSETRRPRQLNSAKAIGKAQANISGALNTKTSLSSEKAETNQVKLEKDEKLEHCPWSLDEPLEACDIQGNWYPAKIVEIKDFQVKIHFLRWK